MTNHTPRPKQFKDVTTRNQNVTIRPPILKGIGTILAAGLSDGSCCLFCFSNMAVRASGSYSWSSYHSKRAPRVVVMEYTARILGKRSSPSVSLFHCHFHATSTVYIECTVYIHSSATQSQWPRFLSRGAAAAGLLLLRVRNPPCWVIVLSFASVVCCQIFLCNRPITSTEKSYRGVLFLNVISEHQQWGSLGPLGLLSHEGEKIRCLKDNYRPKLFRDVMWHFPKKIET